MKRLDKMKFVIGLVLLFGGLDLAILLSHLSRLWGIPLIAAGVLMLAWAARGMERRAPVRRGRPANIASSIIHYLTFEGRFRELIPIAGIAIAALVLAFNLLVRGDLYLGSNDYVALVLAGVLVSYNSIPKRYSSERDFALLFTILLFFLLVIPTTLLSLRGGEADTNTPLTYWLLAMPTAFLAQMLGIPVIAPGTNPTTGLLQYNFMEVADPSGAYIPLNISLSCSGLYSVAIFVSAFLAFVAVEHRRLDRRVGLLLCIGILLAWIANVIRMAIIVAVGRHSGADAMLWVHNNIGELIFMAWVSLFWLFMFRYFGVLEAQDGKAPSGRRKGICGVCGEPLSPVVPASRCECGAISHSGCILTNQMRCPSCGVEQDLKEGHR